MRLRRRKYIFKRPKQPSGTRVFVAIFVILGAFAVVFYFGFEMAEGAPITASKFDHAIAQTVGPLE